MAIEQITDSNYIDFKKYPRSVLLVTISWCQPCKDYEPIINTLSNQIPYIKFGKTIIDKDKSIQLKKEYHDLNSWKFPTTLLFKNQKEISRIQGVAPYSNVLSKIKDALILESKVFVPGSNGKYIPAIINYIQDNNDIYRIKLMEDSSLGEKNNIIEIKKEKFLWSLELNL